MPSDFHIPQAGYRQFRRSAGLDPATRRLALTAAALGGALVLLVGGWMTLGHRQTGVPLVLADTHPIRVKPENPGGMQVIGANDGLLPGDSGNGKDAVAPAPETPQLQALQQEIQAAKAARPRAPAPAASAPPSPGPAAALVASAPAAPVPAAPAAAPAALAAPQIAARSSPRPEAKPGGTIVQVAALASEQAAKLEWERLGRRAPALLNGRKPLIARADVGGRAVYRLRIAGFADMAAATEFCVQLRAKGGGCSIADF